MVKKIIKDLLGDIGGKDVREVRKTQILYLIGIILIIICVVVIFSDSEEIKQKKGNEEVVFDGVFGENFSKLSDEALIDKQALKIDDLEKRSSLLEQEKKKGYKDENARSSIMLLKHKLDLIERENQSNKEALSVALLKASRLESRNRKNVKTKINQTLNNEYYEKINLEKSGMKTVRFRAAKRAKKARSSDNYVWGGTFAEGVMLTGAKADAGINGSKNTGIIAIRLTSNGTMPNKQKSHLKDCVVLASSYGDLSDDSVVMHLETMSCASNKINFEKKVYGGVFDSDAMQDVRGTSILKTKPLLEYSAAAGLLAGLGDGLRSWGSAQSVNSNGSITTFSPSNLGRGALGSAMSNPANRIADYVMKVADIYHPVVKARPGRIVTVLFSKGFFIDKEHQKYETYSKKNINPYNEKSRSASNLRGVDINKIKKESAMVFLNKENKSLFTELSQKGDKQ